MPSLQHFSLGQQARLTSFANIEPTYRHRLLAMGLTPGITVTIQRKAPLGCPIQVGLRNTSVSLRLNEINALEWELVK